MSSIRLFRSIIHSPRTVSEENPDTKSPEGRRLSENKKPPAHVGGIRSQRLVIECNSSYRKNMTKHGRQCCTGSARACFDSQHYRKLNNLKSKTQTSNIDPVSYHRILANIGLRRWQYISSIHWLTRDPTKFYSFNWKAECLDSCWNLTSDAFPGEDRKNRSFLQKKA